MALLRLILLPLLLLAALPARGHEFWISPEAYQIAPGEPLVAHLRVGADFVGSSQTYFPRRFARFEVKMGETSQPVEGRLGDIPALSVMPQGEGLAVIVHETRGDSLRYQTRDLFEDFVAHKDLAGTLERHAARGLPELEFREAYTRYAKALVAVGAGEGRDAITGLRIELVALANPYRDDLSTGLPVLLLYQGAARADAQIELFTRAPGGDVSARMLRTDAAGVAMLPVEPGHEYLVDSVVMEDTGNDDPADGPVWHSAWASLTFKVP